MSTRPFAIRSTEALGGLTVSATRTTTIATYSTEERARVAKLRRRPDLCLQLARRTSTGWRRLID
jgi:hypothetical protein